jgi:hypothetical protein
VHSFRKVTLTVAIWSLEQRAGELTQTDPFTLSASSQHLCLQELADQLLQKTGGNPLMIRVLAAQLRAAGDPLEPGNFWMWRNAVEDINFNSQLLRLEDYTCHPKDAYRDTIKRIGSQAQRVLAVLYRFCKPLQKVPIVDLLETWKQVIALKGGSSREEDFYTGLDDLHVNNAVERYQHDAHYPHGVHTQLSTLS